MASTNSLTNNQTIQNKITFNLSKIQIMWLVMSFICAITFVTAIITAGAFQSQNKNTKEVLDKNIETKLITNLPPEKEITPVAPQHPLGSGTNVSEDSSLQVVPPQPALDKVIDGNTGKDTKNLAANTTSASDLVVKLKYLSPQDFHDILENQTFENTKTPEITVSITGNAGADNHINKLAESRGYRLWSQADESTLVELENGIKLQPMVKENYLKMVEEAKNEGLAIGLLSGYRSQENQNAIFKPRLEALEMAQLGGYYTPEEFLTGVADEIIKQSMALTAPPGYSRHQTGYTVDLSDRTPDNTTTVFKGSKADIWLSKDNYANARRFGFIPSYPVGQQNIGPEPEAWEYVWVGDSAK